MKISFTFLWRVQVGQSASQTGDNINGHREKGSQGIEQYESSFRNSIVVMKALKMKKVKEDNAFWALNILKAIVEQNSRYNVREMSEAFYARRLEPNW